MRLITAADDELFHALSVAAKMGRHSLLLDRLRRRRDAEPGNPEAARPYALGLMAALPTVGDRMESHAWFSHAIDAFGDVLAVAPDDWLARYSRARLRAMVTSGYGVVAANFADELEGAGGDLAYLVEYQSREPWHGYFAGAHALAAFVTWLSDELLPAPVDAGRIARLVAAAAARPAAPVPLPALSAILCEPFVALHGMLTGPDRRRIRELMVSLYGGQPAVVAALTVPAAEVPAAEVPA